MPELVVIVSENDTLKTNGNNKEFANKSLLLCFTHQELFLDVDHVFYNPDVFPSHRTSTLGYVGPMRIGHLTPFKMDFLEIKCL